MKIGILSFGIYFPCYRIKTSEIAKIWGKDEASVVCSLGVKEKSVAGQDEDSFTMGLEAALMALNSASIEKSAIKRLYFGSESPVYAVNPTSSIIGEFLGLSGEYLSYDAQFACKAGTSVLASAFDFAKGSEGYALVVASDKALGAPSDALEYTTGSGAAAVLVGRSKELLLELEGYTSWTSDTPDFWRREGEKFPSHAGRFTGEPAYFKHVTAAAKLLFEKLKLSPKDFSYAAFHSPNKKFPIRAAKALGFEKEQYEPSLIVERIGNTYTASSFLALAAILQKAKVGERILLVSYGSGAGSDAFSFKVSRGIKRRPDLKVFFENQKYIDYPTYLKFIQKL